MSRFKVSRRKFVNGVLVTSAGLLVPRRGMTAELDFEIPLPASAPSAATSSDEAKLQAAEAEFGKATYTPCVDFDPTPEQLQEFYKDAADNKSNVEAIEQELQMTPDALLSNISSLGPDAKQHAVQEGIIQRNMRWPEGATVSWSFLNRRPTDSQAIGREEACVAAMRRWSDITGLEFRDAGRNNNSANIRIAFAFNRGHYSFIGVQSKRGRGRAGLGESMNIDPKPGAAEDYSRIALHEFGHAISAVHEQFHSENPIRWNKPVVYAHFARSGWDRSMVDHNVFQRIDNPNYESGRYVATEKRDPKAVMQYAFPLHFHFNRDGSVPSTPNPTISEPEEQFFRAQYNNPVKPSKPKPNPSEPKKSNVRHAELVLGKAGLTSQEIGSAGDATLYKFKTKGAGTYVIETFDDAPSITMKLTLFRSAGMSDRIGDPAHHNGRRILNARIEQKLEAGKTYYVLAEHFFKTQSSVGKFNIRAIGP